MNQISNPPMKTQIETLIPAMLVTDVAYSVDVFGQVYVNEYRVTLEGTLSLDHNQLYEIDAAWSKMAEEIAYAQAERAAQRRAEDRAEHKLYISQL